jgi:predicted nucleic acid-binding protein
MPSTPTEALLDVNVVIASIFADHVMQETARQFVETLRRFHTTPTIQGGFLSLRAMQGHRQWTDA